MVPLPSHVPVDIPDGVSGDWSVRTFTVTKQDEELGRIRSIFSSSSRGRYVPAGTYKGLYHHNRVVMSNTPDEIRDHASIFYRARGSVLVNGLGLGVILKMILEKPKGPEWVQHVTVVEISKDVINLVAPHIQAAYSSRVTVIESDAFTYKPVSKYDAVWHDIWNDICDDNRKEMGRLHRKYARRCTWQGSWSRG